MFWIPESLVVRQRGCRGAKDHACPCHMLCPCHMHRTHSSPGKMARSTTTHWFSTHIPSKGTSELPNTVLKAWRGCQPQLMASPEQGELISAPHRGNKGNKKELRVGARSPLQTTSHYWLSRQSRESHEANSPGSDCVCRYRVGIRRAQAVAGARTNNLPYLSPVHPPFPTSRSLMAFSSFFPSLPSTHKEQLRQVCRSHK